MAFIETSNLKVYYERAGQGKPLLVINGTGSDLRNKPNIMDSPLTRHFAVTSYDQRGLGQTEKPVTGYTMESYGNDATALLDAPGLEQVMILGISFGGMVAQEMAIRHGARISKLALFCTSPGGVGGASYPSHELAGLDETTRLHQHIKLSDTRIDDQWLEQNPALVDMARVRTDTHAYAHETGYARGIAGQLEARRHHDCWDRLAQITCPVWLAGGTYDAIATPAAMRNMAARLPQAQLTLYAGGHLFMLQDAQAFSDLIAFFAT